MDAMKRFGCCMSVVLLLLAFSETAFADREKRRQEAALVNAARTGDIDTVSKLLAAGVSPDAKRGRSDPNTALMYAVNRGYLEIITMLLAAGASPKGNAILAEAVKFKSTDTLRVLLEAGADAAGTSGSQALLRAIDNRREAMARMLLEAGANPNSTVNYRGESVTALMLALSRRNPSPGIVKLLLEKGADPSLAAGEDGTTPLLRASLGGLEEQVRMLLDAGADATGTSGSHALLDAINRRRENIARMLLEAGANPNSTGNYRGESVTALMLAFKYRKAIPSVIYLLLEKGANPSLIVSEESTPLISAAYAGEIEWVNAFIKAGADVNASLPPYDWTPLMFAIKAGHVQTAALLLAAGADPNASSNNGWTPLLLTARSCSLVSKELCAELAYRLLEAGARVDGTANKATHLLEHPEGTTPLMLAVSGGSDNGPLVRMLLEAGADMDAVNASGQSARSHVSRSRNVCIAGISVVVQEYGVPGNCSQ